MSLNNMSTMHVNCTTYVLQGYFLAPPAEWQRNFSNADLSVVRPSDRPSLFSLKVSDNFFFVFVRVQLPLEGTNIL